MIYVDNAATTKMDDVVIAGMLPYIKDYYGNASSQYSFGQLTRKTIAQARHEFALALNAEDNEIFFTSGGSESDNWAIKGVAQALRNKGNHIITSSIEHPAVLNACKAIEKIGFEVTYLPVDKYGMVSPEAVQASLRPNTILISIMYANNEVGTLQPIKEIGLIAKKSKILFHTDAVQAVGHIDIDVIDLGVNLLTASAHKFHGPKGVGILYVKERTPIVPLVDGGHQENGQRAGTENVAGIVGAGIAIKNNLTDLKQKTSKLKMLSSSTVAKLRSRLPSIIINGHETKRLPGIINTSIPKIEGESMMLLLDMKGICISTGSACTAGEMSTSHVLHAMGLNQEDVKSAIRISFGKYNQPEDVDKIVDAICFAYDKVVCSSHRR
jgi:cysteine desulfurase